MGCGSSDAAKPTKVDKKQAEDKKKNDQGKDHQSKNQKSLKEQQPQKPEVIFVLGGPGSGKGTQCTKLKDDYGFIHLSTGDLLREERLKGGKDADEIENYMKEGKLVPSSMLVRLLQKEFQSNGNLGRYLLDGFPRSQDNLNAWNEIIKDTVDVKFLLVIECSFEVMEERLLKRGETSGRSDDNPETIKKRFETFTNETEPIIKQFAKAYRVQSDKPVAEGYTQIVQVLEENSIRRLTKPSVVFVLGGPGSGKGTQCTRLREDFQFVHLSTGDLLRAEQKAGGPNAEMIDTCIKEGKLMPSVLLIKLIRKQFLINNMKGKYILDGFPRSDENVKVWNEIMGHLVDFKFLLFFKCSFEVMEKRILGRGEGRIDDNPETIKKRFDTFTNETMPIVEYFRQQGKFLELNAEQPVDKVYSQLKKAIKEHQLDRIPKNKDDKLEKIYKEPKQHKEEKKDSKQEKTDDKQHNKNDNKKNEESEEDERPQKKQYVIFVVGGPGSGKGTQCANIIQKYPEFKHLSTGDLLRDELKTQSAESKMIDQFMKEGKLVPSELLVKLVQKKIESDKSVRKFLLDGFPRSLENVNSWKAVIGRSINMKYLLFFEVPLDVMEQRLLERAQTSGRADDNPETIKKRLVTYTNETVPIIDFYTHEEKVLSVDAQGSIAEVFASAETILKRHKVIGK